MPSNLEQLTELVSQAAMLFHLAESECNPQVQTYWDALHYIATSLSVGYANIFPVTPIGKAIGAMVMMVGRRSRRRRSREPRRVDPADLPLWLATE